MQELVELLDYRFFDNTLRNWAIALLAFFITFTVRPAFRRFLVALADRRGVAGRTVGVDLLLCVVARTSHLFLWILALYVAVSFLTLPPAVDRVARGIVLVALWVQVGLWLSAVLDFVLRRQQQRYGVREPALAGSLTLIRFAAMAAAWALVSLVALDNLGVDVAALIAGLGIIGLAVALALKTLLSDLFSYIAIVLDEPFEIGDTVAIDEFRGKVEDLGLKNTRLRSVDGELIVMSNTDVLKSRLRNFGRMSERRGTLLLNIAYGTPLAKLLGARRIIEAAIREQAGVRFDRCHLVELGRSSLKFEAVFFVENPEMAEMAAAQTAINLRIHEAFADEGIAFAYPTQKLLLSTHFPK